MKTSTKIILTYTILLLTGALTIYIAEIFVGKGGQEKKLYKVFTKDLSPFSTVVAEENARFCIEMGDSNSVVWVIPKDMSKETEPVFVRNDTLYVTKTLTGKVKDFVIRCKSLTTIVASKSSSIHLVDPILDKLKISGKGGEIFIDREKYNNAIRIGQIDIVGKKMDRIVIDIPLDYLNAQLDGVPLTMLSFVDKVNIQMLNKSSFRIVHFPWTQLTIEKDSSSLIQIN